MSSTTKSKKRRRRSVAQFSSSTNTTKSDTPGAASDASVATPDRDAGVSGLTGTPDEQSAPRSGKRGRIAIEDVASSRSLRSSCTAKGKEAAERLLLAGEQSQQQPTVHSSLSSTRPRQSRRHIVARSIPSTQAERSRASEATADASSFDLGAAPFAVVKASENRNSTQPRKRRRLSNEDSALGGSVRGSCSPQNAIAPQKGGDIDSLSPAASNPLESLLQQSFPYLEKNPLHTSSKATRPPKMYDTHMGEELRLKKIVILPGLLDALSDICDQYVKRVAGTGKDLSPSFPEFQVPSDEDIVNETTLVKYLEQRNVLFSKLASGLLFRTDWQPVFEFSSHATGAKSSPEAAADAYLFINKRASARVSPQHQLDIALVEKYDLHNFVTWEYKNLGFGSDVFRALKTQEGKFHWTACQERLRRHDPSFSCLNQNHRKNGKLVVTGRPTGPDSDVTVDIIKSLSAVTVADDEETDVDEAVEKKVRYIIQQAWGSAVARDSSDLVISTGNEDCIGFRHRESQTLFLSPPIKPSDKKDPSYVKVYVGLYIHAFEDVVDRARQLESGNLSAFAQSSLRVPLTDRPNLPNATASGLFDKYPAEIRLPPLSQYFVQHLHESLFIDLRLHQHKLATTQSNRNTWILTRSMANSDSTNIVVPNPPDISPAPSDSEVVFLDLEHLVKGTSRIWKVYLGVARGEEGKVEYFPEPLILKMSRDANEGSFLRTEAENYQRLHADGVTSIVKCYGFFSCQVNSNDRRYFLLLENGGNSIAKRTETTLLAHTKKYRDTYNSALMSFHCKKYTHNNITEDHVLMNSSKEAKLISLKGCEIPDQAIAALRQEQDAITMTLCLGNSSGASQVMGSARQVEESNNQNLGSGPVLQPPDMFNSLDVLC